MAKSLQLDVFWLFEVYFHFLKRKFLICKVVYFRSLGSQFNHGSIKSQTFHSIRQTFESKIFLTKKEKKNRPGQL